MHFKQARRAVSNIGAAMAVTKWGGFGSGVPSLGLEIFEK